MQVVVVCDPDTADSCDDLLHRFEAELLEKHLKKRGNRPQHNAVKFALDDVVVPEVIKIEADDVEDSIGQQREAVQEELFRECPIRELGRLLKKDDNK